MAAYAEGDVMEDESGRLHGRHTLQDIGEEGYVDRVRRTLDVAHAEAVELLFPFTRREIDNTILDNRLRERKVYAIGMNVPEDFSQTTLNALKELLHEFMVSAAVADWIAITNPLKAPVWKERMEKLKEALRVKATVRRGRVRRGLHPF